MGNADTNKLNYTGQIVYTLALVTVKMGILMLYLRVFGTNANKRFRWTIIGIMIFGALHGVGYGFAIIFQCLPVSAIWDSNITDPVCIHYGSLVLSASIISLTEDFLLVLLPIPQLLKLQVSGRKRIGLGIMFAVASL
jgi:hypothetical protein